MRFHVVFAVAAVLVTACSGGSDAGARQRAVSCDDSAAGICETVTGTMSDRDVSDLRAECTALGGAPIDGACPTASTVPGHCHYDVDAGRTNDAYYASARWTPADARAHCAAPPPGIWVPAAASGSFSATGSMTTARSGHAAALLPSGKVLVAGGYVADGSAELYDPATGTFSPTGSMAQARGRCTATLLASGEVLVVGEYLATTELYDPDTGTFSPSGSMAASRGGHTATLLPSGAVLVAGGTADGSAELYDPATGTFSATGSMAIPRGRHTATLLPGGKVLVAGGAADDPRAELYDPATGTFTLTGSMTSGRFEHAATLLSTGEVLVAGGWLSSATSATKLATAELYDPATATFTATGAMAEARPYLEATLLASGAVLVTGGFGDGTPVPPVRGPPELYDASAGSFAPTGDLSTARFGHSATLLPGGQVLVAGGSDGASQLRSAELFSP